MYSSRHPTPGGSWFLVGSREWSNVAHSSSHRVRSLLVSGLRRSHVYMCWCWSGLWIVSGSNIRNRDSMYCTQLTRPVWASGCLITEYQPSLPIYLLTPTISGTKRALEFSWCFHVLVKEDILSIQNPIHLNLPHFTNKVSTDSILFLLSP